MRSQQSGALQAPSASRLARARPARRLRKAAASAHVAACRPAPLPLLLLQLKMQQVGAAYANALVEVAKKTSSLEAVHADVDALAGVMKENAVCAASLPVACVHAAYVNAANCPRHAAAQSCAAAARAPRRKLGISPPLTCSPSSRCGIAARSLPAGAG